MSKNKYPQPVDSGKEKIRTRKINFKNDSQKLYIQAIEESDIVICKGPAGTGKTFLASYVAINMLLENKISKIYLTRPIVDAGEHLGFLPGDLDEKVHPYLLPLLDAFEYFVGPTKLKELREYGLIEVAPLAYMRGRTMRDCLTGDAKVLLSDGTYIDIENLVERYQNGEQIVVKSFNHQTSSLEDITISFAFEADPQEDLYEIELEDGTILKVTGDHKFYTSDDGYIETKELKVGSTLQQLV